MRPVSKPRPSSRVPSTFITTRRAGTRPPHSAPLAVRRRAAIFCVLIHPAADAMLHLRATHNLEPGRVARVESWTHPRRLAHTNRPDPQSGLDGKFSIQYVLARSLMHGIVSLEHFGDDTVRDSAVRALMAKVHSLPDPNATPDTDNHFYARVRVTTNGGEAFEHFVDM